MRQHQFRTLAPAWRIAVLALALGLALVDLTLTGGLSLEQIRPAFAQEGGSQAWERLPGPDGRVGRLFTPASGALLADATGELYRTDDGGLTWRAIAVPASKISNRAFAVDPTNHDVLYADGDDGLVKSTDAGTNWSLVLPRDEGFPWVTAVEVSPADPNVLYVVLSDRNSKTLRFMRSRDGGASWEMTEEDGYESISCYWSVTLLRPHPTDPNRVFRAVDCSRVGDPTPNLQESRDQGTTWTILIATGNLPPELIHDIRTTPAPSATPAPVGRVEPAPSGGRLIVTARELVGGFGPSASRFYLAAQKDSRGGGSSLLRTDDDGRVWQILFDASGGGTATGPDTRANVTIGGIAGDPAQPDRLYATFREQVKGGPAVVTARVSEDAGAAWTDLATLPVDQVNDLGLGIDGANLYATTDQGVWRLALR